MVKIRRTWTKITDPTILKIYKEVCDEARNKDLLKTPNPPLYSSNFTGALGKCFSSKNFNNTYDNVIVLSNYLLNKGEQMRNTIIHELAHSIVPKDKHGYQWKRIGDTIGLKWGEVMSRLSNEEDLCNTLKAYKPQSTYKYALYCPTCGLTWKYKSNCQAIQRPSRYQCPHCEIELQSKSL